MVWRTDGGCFGIVAFEIFHLRRGLPVDFLMRLVTSRTLYTSMKGEIQAVSEMSILKNTGHPGVN
jgi:hypothetical protein